LREARTAAGAGRAPPCAGGARLSAFLAQAYWAVQDTSLLEQVSAPFPIVTSTWSTPLACPAASKEPLIVPLPLAGPPLTVNGPPQCLVASIAHGSENEIPKFGTIPLPSGV